MSLGEGPGDFNSIDAVVRALLQNAGYDIGPARQNITDALNFSQPISPEMYLGYQELQSGRADYLGDATGLRPAASYNYTLSNISHTNAVYLAGEWYSAPQYLMAVNNSRIFLVYYARKVNIVAGGNSTLYVYLDGNALNDSYLGTDARLVNGTATVTINSPRLYNVVSAPSYGAHLLEIDAKPGFKIYTFTFG